uniref:Small ribosomal subunit protein uS15 n=1 Tax=Oncorhynchus tshawytscha TaxID=74940 RepID=A0A8C8CQN8_ONCTS
MQDCGYFTQEHLTSFPHTDTKSSFQSAGSPLFFYRHYGSHACSRKGLVPVGVALQAKCPHCKYNGSSILLGQYWSAVYYTSGCRQLVSTIYIRRWLKLASDDVKEQIFKLAKKGLTPSQIGVILRDSHGVAQVRFVTGNKILRILKTKGLAPDLPEDLYHLIKKAVAVRKHLERNRKDKDAKFRLILTESRIHRLARYYKTRRVVAPNWKYESSTASALVA